MSTLRTFLGLMGLLVAAMPLTASGPLGIYGIVERVVMEPNEKAPERIQVWGAFAYVDGMAGEGLTVSAAKRGYLYFRLPTLRCGGYQERMGRSQVRRGDRTSGWIRTVGLHRGLWWPSTG